MHYYIITGTSKGLGEALAKKWISPEHHLFCISRSRNEELIKIAEQANCPLQYFEADLTNTALIPQLFATIMGHIIKGSARSVTLINNAGTVHPTSTIDQATAQEIQDNLALNLTAPMVLSSELIRSFAEWSIPKHIINITSGAGKNPYYGWSCYCTAKAGIDMFTRSVAVEESYKENPVRILSIAPGVVDTPMQAEIRTKSIKQLRNVDYFIQLKDEGKLLSPELSSTLIVKMMSQSTYENGSILDVRDIKDT